MTITPNFLRQPINKSFDYTEIINFYNDYLGDIRGYKEDLIVDLSGLVKIGAYLEVNAKTGYIGLDLARLNNNIFILALEPNEVLYQQALLNSRAMNLFNWAIKNIFLTKNLFSNNELFEVVYSVGALHLWHNPMLVIKKMYELLKPNGVLVINDLCREADNLAVRHLLSDIKNRYEESKARIIIDLFAQSLLAAFSVDELEKMVTELKMPMAKISFIYDSPLSFTMTVIK